MTPNPKDSFDAYSLGCRVARRPYEIPTQPTIEREAQNAEAEASAHQGETPELSGRNDPREIPGFPRPGPDQRSYESETERYRRMANRPPDAALDPTDVAMLDLEQRARRNIAEVNRLYDWVDKLLTGVSNRDAIIKRQVRYFRLMILACCIAGVVIASLAILLARAWGWL